MDELIKLEAKRKKSFTFFLVGIICVVVGVIAFMLTAVGVAPLPIIAAILVVPGIVFIIIGAASFNSLEKEFKNKMYGKNYGRNNSWVSILFKFRNTSS